jgi:hypothetical protein
MPDLPNTASAVRGCMTEALEPARGAFVIYDPEPAQLLSGKVRLAILSHNHSYVAWTPTWEGPPRPDYPAAMADLRDRVESVP